MSSEPEQEQSPQKLIIDEGWKEQVRREKEELQQQRGAGGTPQKPGLQFPQQATTQRQSAGEAPSSEGSISPEAPSAESRSATTSAQSSSGGTARSTQEVPLPEASLPTLVAMLQTQAFSALGLMPHPISGQAERDLPQARLFIDLLGVLEDRTRGNLTDGENRLLTEVLQDLRMYFIKLQREG